MLAVNKEPLSSSNLGHLPAAVTCVRAGTQIWECMGKLSIGHIRDLDVEVSLLIIHLVLMDLWSLYHFIYHPPSLTLALVIVAFRSFCWAVSGLASTACVLCKNSP